MSLSGTIDMRTRSGFSATNQMLSAKTSKVSEKVDRAQFGS